MKIGINSRRKFDFARLIGNWRRYKTNYKPYETIIHKRATPFSLTVPLTDNTKRPPPIIPIIHVTPNDNVSSLCVHPFQNRPTASARIPTISWGQITWTTWRNIEKSAWRIAKRVARIRDRYVGVVSYIFDRSFERNRREAPRARSLSKSIIICTYCIKYILLNNVRNVRLLIYILQSTR